MGKCFCLTWLATVHIQHEKCFLTSVLNICLISLYTPLSCQPANNNMKREVLITFILKTVLFPFFFF